MSCFKKQYLVPRGIVIEILLNIIPQVYIYLLQHPVRDDSQAWKTFLNGLTCRKKIRRGKTHYVDLYPPGTLKCTIYRDVSIAHLGIRSLSKCFFRFCSTRPRYNTIHCTSPSLEHLKRGRSIKTSQQPADISPTENRDRAATAFLITYKFTQLCKNFSNVNWNKKVYLGVNVCLADFT